MADDARSWTRRRQPRRLSTLRKKAPDAQQQCVDAAADRTNACEQEYLRNSIVARVAVIIALRSGAIKGPSQEQVRAAVCILSDDPYWMSSLWHLAYVISTAHKPSRLVIRGVDVLPSVTSHLNFPDTFMPPGSIMLYNSLTHKLQQFLWHREKNSKTILIFSRGEGSNFSLTPLPSTLNAIRLLKQIRGFLEYGLDWDWGESTDVVGLPSFAEFHYSVAPVKSNLSHETLDTCVSITHF
jgi:hypothetical protein